KKRNRVERSLNGEPDVAIRRGRDVVWIRTSRQLVVLDSSQSGRRLSNQRHSRNQDGSNNGAPSVRAYECRHFLLLAFLFSHIYYAPYYTNISVSRISTCGEPTSLIRQ